MSRAATPRSTGRPRLLVLPALRGLPSPSRTVLGPPDDNNPDYTNNANGGNEPATTLELWGNYGAYDYEGVPISVVKHVDAYDNLITYEYLPDGSLFRDLTYGGILANADYFVIKAGGHDAGYLDLPELLSGGGILKTGWKNFFRNPKNLRRMAAVKAGQRVLKPVAAPPMVWVRLTKPPKSWPAHLLNLYQGLHPGRSFETLGLTEIFVGAKYAKRLVKRGLAEYVEMY